MSVSVSSRPIKSGCNFNAVGNPIVYRLLRADFSFDQINNSSGFAQIQFNGVNRTAYYQVGDVVYVQRSGYNVPATVTASSFGTNTLVTLDIAYVNTGTGVLNNNSKRTDYKINVQIFNENNVAISPVLSYSPLPSGVHVVDVSGVLKSYLRASWTDVIADSARETDTAIRVYIKYQEYYDGALVGSVIDDSANMVIAVFAVMQLLLDPLTITRYPHGGNLLAFFPEGNTDLWLSRFSVSGGTVPIWRDYPFTISFLYPEALSGIQKRIVQKDASGDVLSTTDTTLDNDPGCVHRFPIGTVDSQAATLEVTLLDSSNDAISSTLTLEVREPCENPVYLFWKNAFGGDSFYMFDYNQEYGYDFRNSKKSPKLTLFADDLTASDWEALNELNSPSDVFQETIIDLNMDESIERTQFRDDQQVYIVSPDGDKIGVTVVATSQSLQTKAHKHAIEIQIELPEAFVI
jgi:hypothetical protein